MRVTDLPTDKEMEDKDKEKGDRDKKEEDSDDGMRAEKKKTTLGGSSSDTE